MNSRKRLEDREVNNLVLYSVGLLIVAGISFTGSSADPAFDGIFVFYTGVGTLAGLLGTIQGCSRNQGLAVAEMVGLAVSFVFALYSNIDYFRDVLYLLAVSWGFNFYDVLVYLWMLAAQLVIFFYLGIGILFCNRVRLILDRKNGQLQDRLL